MKYRHARCIPEWKTLADSELHELECQELAGWLWIHNTWNSTGHLQNSAETENLPQFTSSASLFFAALSL